jgi:hypothetical protein
VQWAVKWGVSKKLGDRGILLSLRMDHLSTLLQRATQFECECKPALRVARKPIFDFGLSAKLMPKALDLLFLTTF